MPPPGIVFKEIDRVSGLLATGGCTDTIEEAFVQGTEPVDFCPLHPEDRKGRGKEKGRGPGLFEKIRGLFD